MVDNSCGYNGTTIGFPWMRKNSTDDHDSTKGCGLWNRVLVESRKRKTRRNYSQMFDQRSPLLFNLIFPFLFLWDYVPGDSVRKIQPRFLFYPLPRGPIGGFTFEKIHSKIQFLIFFLSKNKDRYPERLPTSNIDNVWVTSSVSILPGRCWLQTIKWNRLLNKFSNKSQ